jgi:endonuclease III
MDTSQKNLAQEVQRRLLIRYGHPDWGNPVPPLDELVSTILSQNTNDQNRDAAYRSLRSRFPTWEAVCGAPVQSVVDAIRVAGLANQKGPRIQAILQKILTEQGVLDLAFLRQLPPKEVHQWLLNLDGVGPKTAAIVMLFSLGMPMFPVDTHIYRVSGRLGLRPAEMTVEQTHDHLGSLFPVEAYAPVHLNLIHLGRELCSARQPKCSICPLVDICDFGQAKNSSL